MIWIIILAVVFVCSFSVACCLKARRERLEAAAAAAQEAEPFLKLSESAPVANRKARRNSNVLIPSNRSKLAPDGASSGWWF